MRRSTVDWPATLKEFQSSGLSQKKFCDQRGISLWSLSYQLKKSREPVGPGEALAEPRFVELDLVPRPAATVASGCDKTCSLVVELPFGVVLRFNEVGR